MCSCLKELDSTLYSDMEHFPRYTIEWEKKSMIHKSSYFTYYLNNKTKQK